MSWVVSFLVLSLLIFLHELGHYSAARFFGVYVEIFSIGFGKKLFSFQAFGTQWQVSAIPLGGYVKMKGQEDMNPTALSYDTDSYTVKKPWQKILILAAGPLANFFTAWVLFLGIAFGNPQVHLPVAGKAVVGEVIKDSPAQKGGILPRDTILSVNGKAITQWEELSETISHSTGSLTLIIDRNGTRQTLMVTPKVQESTNLFKEKIQKRLVGIAPLLETHHLDFFGKIDYASKQTYDTTVLIVESVQKLLTGVVPAKEVGGVVSIVKITADATAYGWMSIFFLAALISINLGVLNFLPIPALDGGHIVLNLYEMIRGKAPSESFITQATIMGWVILMGLMMLGLYNDIMRLLP